MLLWCSYCQSYICEKEPMEDFSISHTICTSCLKNPESKVNDVNIKKLKSFFNEILFSVKNGEKVDHKELLEKGKALGVKPLDLFQGIIQPILWEIGNLYEKGLITVHKEHLFTYTCDSLLQKLKEELSINENSKNVDVLLTILELNPSICSY